MGVKASGYYVECTGECRTQDRHGHGRLLGMIQLDDDRWAYWYRDPQYRIRDVAENEADDWVEGEFYRDWDKVEVVATHAPGTKTFFDFRVTCDRCRHAWVFEAQELTERHAELASRHPSVALAGVDVGRPVGR